MREVTKGQKLRMATRSQDGNGIDKVSDKVGVTKWDVGSATRPLCRSLCRSHFVEFRKKGTAHAACGSQPVATPGAKVPLQSNRPTTINIF